MSASTDIASEELSEFFVKRMMAAITDHMTVGRMLVWVVEKFLVKLWAVALFKQHLNCPIAR